MLFVDSPVSRTLAAHLGVLLTAVCPCRCNNENEWFQVHENIIRKSNTKYSAPSTNYGKSLQLHLLSVFDFITA